MTVAVFDPRLTTYFGDATLQAGFMPLPNLFLRHYAELGLSGQQAMFVMQLMATTWDFGSPPATLSDIAGRMGIARRTAQAISAELHAKGVLEIYEQYNDGGSQIENGYDLDRLFQQLAAFASAPQPSKRQRRMRAEASSKAAAATIVPPLEETITPAWQESASSPSRNDHPSPDHEIQAPRQESARLKAELRLFGRIR